MGPVGKSLEERIDRLLRRDRLLALVFTVAMWLALVYVYVRALGAVGSRDIAIVLGVAMILLGALNTASTVALIRRYRVAKDAVYRPDIEHLDRRRALQDSGGRG
jgi:hypothetical protein